VESEKWTSKPDLAPKIKNSDPALKQVSLQILTPIRIQIRHCAHLSHAFTYILYISYYTYWNRIRLRIPKSGFFPKFKSGSEKCSRTPDLV